MNRQKLALRGKTRRDVEQPARKVSPFIEDGRVGCLT
jgi:hypothetical protein